MYLCVCSVNLIELQLFSHVDGVGDGPDRRARHHSPCSTTSTCASPGASTRSGPKGSAGKSPGSCPSAAKQEARNRARAQALQQAAQRKREREKREQQQLGGWPRWQEQRPVSGWPRWQDQHGQDLQRLVAQQRVSPSPPRALPPKSAQPPPLALGHKGGDEEAVKSVVLRPLRVLAVGGGAESLAAAIEARFGPAVVHVCATRAICLLRSLSFLRFEFLSC